MGSCLAAGWSEQQFWRSSYRAVYNLLYTVNKKEENRRRELWEMTRRICAHVIAPYRKKGTEGEPVFALPWDNLGKKQRVLTPEELAARKAKFARWDAAEKAKYNGEK